jgi:hypothetical protein
LLLERLGLLPERRPASESPTSPAQKSGVYAASTCFQVEVLVLSRSVLRFSVLASSLALMPEKGTGEGYVREWMRKGPKIGADIV